MNHKNLKEIYEGSFEMPAKPASNSSVPDSIVVKCMLHDVEWMPNIGVIGHAMVTEYSRNNTEHGYRLFPNTRGVTTKDFGDENLERSSRHTILNEEGCPIEFRDKSGIVSRNYLVKLEQRLSSVAVYGIAESAMFTDYSSKITETFSILEKHVADDLRSDIRHVAGILKELSVLRKTSDRKR